MSSMLDFHPQPSDFSSSPALSWESLSNLVLHLEYFFVLFLFFSYIVWILIIIHTNLFLWSWFFLFSFKFFLDFKNVLFIMLRVIHWKLGASFRSSRNLVIQLYDRWWLLARITVYILIQMSSGAPFLNAFTMLHDSFEYTFWLVL